MSGLGSAKDPENSSDHLSRLLEGLPVTDRRLELAGTSTPVLEGGDGPPLVLLHGVGGFAEEWGRVIPRLVGSHRVVVPDLPGLGRSQARAGRLDAASVVDWLRHVIEQTCSEPPTLVGHSLGKHRVTLRDRTRRAHQSGYPRRFGLDRPLPTGTGRDLGDPAVWRASEPREPRSIPTPSLGPPGTRSGGMG
jgi:pimeloyl-ACP methyl ester carboxylesterase